MMANQTAATSSSTSTTSNNNSVANSILINGLASINPASLLSLGVGNTLGLITSMPISAATTSTPSSTATISSTITAPPSVSSLLTNMIASSTTNSLNMHHQLQQQQLQQHHNQQQQQHQQQFGLLNSSQITNNSGVLELIMCKLVAPFHLVNDPRLLECGSSPCFSCIMSQKDATDKLKCMYCNGVHKIPQDAANKLIVNRNLQNFLKNNGRPLNQSFSKQLEDSMFDLEKKIHSQNLKMDNLDQYLQIVQNDVKAKVETMKSHLEKYGEQFIENIMSIREEVKKNYLGHITSASSSTTASSSTNSSPSINISQQQLHQQQQQQKDKSTFQLLGSINGNLPYQLQNQQQQQNHLFNNNNNISGPSVSASASSTSHNSSTSNNTTSSTPSNTNNTTNITSLNHNNNNNHNHQNNEKHQRTNNNSTPTAQINNSNTTTSSNNNPSQNQANSLLNSSKQSLSFLNTGASNNNANNNADNNLNASLDALQNTFNFSNSSSWQANDDDLDDFDTDINLKTVQNNLNLSGIGNNGVNNGANQKRHLNKEQAQFNKFVREEVAKKFGEDFLLQHEVNQLDSSTMDLIKNEAINTLLPKDTNPSRAWTLAKVSLRSLKRDLRRKQGIK